MYIKGDKVVHKVHGICIIEDVVSFSYSPDKYYKVYPCEDKKLTIYVPCKNEGSIIRSIISKEEAYSLIEYMKNIDNSIVVDSKSRRDEYARMLTTGNIKDLAFLTKKLYLLREEKIKNNRVIGLIDQDTFETANNMLLDELSLAINISKDEVKDLIINANK